MSLSGGRPLWISGSCWEAPECPGGPPDCPGVIGSPSRMSGCSLETLLDVQEPLQDFR